MLLEGAIGDAYGVPFEYANENLKYNDLSKYIKHPTHGLIPGQFSDDTQMSTAIAELMLSDLEWTPYNIVSKFIEVFKRDERKGYSKLFQEFLERTSTPEEFLANIKGDSDKSGGAMRASCIGYYKTVEEVLEKTTIQCSITHGSPHGIAAARAASLLSWAMLNNIHPKEAGKFIYELVPDFDWRQDYVGKVKSKGFMSSQAAITAVRRNKKLSELLKDCINFSGDVDTVATIAMSAASCSAFYEKDIPQVLVETLENGTYGKDYLIKLDERLTTKYGNK